MTHLHRNRKAITARSHDRLLVRLGFESVLNHERDEPAIHHPAKDKCICFLILAFIAFRVSKVIPNFLLIFASDSPSIAYD
jgi:hypothetical protein